MSFHFRSTRLLGILLLSGIYSLLSLHAMTVQEISTEKLTTDSDVILMGTIVDVRYEWGDEASGVIHTVFTVQSAESVKGEEHIANGTIEVTQLGGRIGELEMHIPGNPRFQEGDEVVFFLMAHQQRFWVHSMVLGAFTVFEEQNGERFIMDMLAGVSVMDAQGNDVPHDEAMMMNLDTFMNGVKAFVNNQ